ncbi:MAG: hypothetical protein Q9191_001668 [Dirinaria sp. TL-2023a]
MLFALSVLAALSFYLLPIQAYEYSTTSLCTTKLGARSTSVKTTTYALTVPVTVTVKSTSTPVSTITPPPQTTSVTATQTTTSIVVTTSVDTQTDTTLSIAIASSANALYKSTVTETITTDTVVVTTSTSTIATSTVPTSAGFTALALESGYVPKKRSVEADAPPAIRGRQVEGRAATTSPLASPLGKPGVFTQYPQAVTCGALVVAKTSKVIVSTAKPTTTTLPAVTNTITSSTTVTETSTSAVSASTTVTTTVDITSVTTVTSTSTNTITQTVTVVQAQSTAYAACDSNNVVQTANGHQPVYNVYYAGSGRGPAITNFDIADPVACCQQCQQLAGCTGYVQFTSYASCFAYTSNQCDGSQSFGQSFQTINGPPPSSGYSIGNGPCGQLANQGSAGNAAF